MYQFTNEQRRCFGLNLVRPDWTLIQLKTSCFDRHEAYAYLDGRTVKKCIFVSERQYLEYDYDETLSDDLTLLLPKTAKGKPVRLSSATMLKRTNRGMAFQYTERGTVDLYCADNQLGYYNSTFESVPLKNLDDFKLWVDRWCAETTEDDIREIEAIKRKPRAHIRYHEGDVFRFKLTRRLYGYGRIIRDYQRLEKEKIPFIRTFMGTAALCAAYLIATEDKNVSLDTLRTLKSLPSLTLNESLLYYGEYEIIGNIPITDDEDYPYVYCRSSDAREWHLKKVLFQNGRDLLTLEGVELIPEIDALPYLHDGGPFDRISLDLLRQCIETDSITPYWDTLGKWDLRNPKNADILRSIRKQFGFDS